MPSGALLRHFDPMVGLDLHDEVAPPNAPAPRVLHLVAGLLCSPPWGALTGKPNPKVWATGGMVLSQGTDMGFLIPHAPLQPASLLAAVLSAGSGSKTSFGAHRNRAKSGALAATVAGATGLNLNCGDGLPPGPTGQVLAFFQLVWQGTTSGDVTAGVLHTVVDVVVQHSVTKMLGFGACQESLDQISARVAAAVNARVARVSSQLAGGRAVGRAVGQVLDGFWVAMRDYHVFEKLPEFLAGATIGTPVGYSVPFSPESGMENGLDADEQSLAQSIDRLFEDPAIEELPRCSPEAVACAS
jgi:hypothetical protein